MPYNSWLYLIFFLGVTVLLYYAVPLKIRWTVLLAASVAFYLLASRQLILVLILGAAVVYAAALRIQKRNDDYQERRAALPKDERKLLKEQTARKVRHILVLACTAALGILFFTKYFNFVGTNVNLLLTKLSLPAAVPALHLIMPMGISFYTLSAVSYLIDVSRGTCRAQQNFLKLLLFLIFFPVITEGPISRYDQLGTQVAEGHRFDYVSFCFGIQRILWGLFQKVVIADRLDAFVGNIFNDRAFYSGSVVLAAVLLYTLQIYTDFAGCIDIARGSAELFGIRLTPNFAQPFFATSVNDFWKRWHITLGAWLRDYVFYPISLSKFFQALSKSSRRHLSGYYAATLPALVALFAVWFLNGVWHGAEWKYICYGLYYYVIMASGMLLEPLFARLTGLLRLDRKSRGFRLWQMLRTFCFVNVGMLIFRADTLGAALSMFRSLFQPYGGSLLAVMNAKGLPVGQLSIALTGAALVFAVDILQERGAGLRDWIAARAVPLRWSIYMAAVLLVLVAGAYGPGFGIVDFIYAQF